MPRVERVSSNVAVPVEQAQLINASAFRFSTAEAEAFGQLGAAVQQMGAEELAVRKELAKKKRDAQDKIGTSNVNAILANAERDYEIDIQDKPLSEHAALLTKHRTNAIGMAGQEDLSPEQRRFVDSKIKIWGNEFADTAELQNIKAIERDALIGVIADFEQALIEGTPEDIIEAEAAFDAQAESSYTPAEAESQKNKVMARAVVQMDKNAISDVRELAAGQPQLAISMIETEQDVRKKGKPKNFPLVSNEDLVSAKQLAKSALVSNENAIQEQFDIAIGEATATVTDGITKGTIKESDIWEMPITVASTKEEDVGTWRSKWAGIVRGIVDRNDTLNQTDSEVYFTMRRKIDTDPESVSNADIAGKVGQGLSVADYEKLVGMITDDEDPLNSRTAKRGDEYLTQFKTIEGESNATGWLEMQNDYDKFYTDFIDQNKRPPTDKESEDYLKFLTFEPVRKFWTNDLPDEDVKIQLGKLPLEAKRDFVRSVEAKQSTTAWLKKWRKKDKKITVEVATHYLQLANGNREKAISLAKRDGYTE